MCVYSADAGLKQISGYWRLKLMVAEDLNETATELYNSEYLSHLGQHWSWLPVEIGVSSTADCYMQVD